MRKPVKFKRYSKGGGVDSNSDFEDTPDTPDTPEGGYVRDSEGKRVRSTYGYVTYGDGPKKAQKAEKPSGPSSSSTSSSPSSSTGPSSSPPSTGPLSGTSEVVKPNKSSGKRPTTSVDVSEPPSDEEPFSISPPADKAKAEGNGKPDDIFRNRPKPPASQRPSANRAVATSNKPLTPITPVEDKPKMEFKAPKSLPSAEPKSLTTNAAGSIGSASSRDPLLSSGSKALPAPSAAEKAAEIARLQKYDRPLQTVETLPGPGKLARLAIGAGKELKDRLLGGERTPQRPPEAKLELPAPAKPAELPAPAKPPATVKSDVSGKARPPRPLPDTPDKDVEAQRAKRRKANMAKKAAANREKAKTFSKGGSVSSRADGCVQRGRTRGKVM